MFGNLRAKYCPRWWLVGYIHCGPITCPRMSCREWFHPYRGWSVARTSEASTLKCLYIINPALFISQNMVRKACSCTPAHSNNGSILRLAYCIAGTCAWLGTHVVHTRVVPSRDDMFFISITRFILALLVVLSYHNTWPMPSFTSAVSVAGDDLSAARWTRTAL